VKTNAHRRGAEVFYVFLCVLCVSAVKGFSRKGKFRFGIEKPEEFSCHKPGKMFQD
jgi:hypothetical protein